MYHDLHGAGLDTLAAANTLLLVDHEHTGLGILGDCIMLAGAHALATLNANIGLCLTILANDNTNAGQILVKLLIEGFGTGLNTLQASHALLVLLNRKLLHTKGFSFMRYFTKLLYSEMEKKQP